VRGTTKGFRAHSAFLAIHRLDIQLSQFIRPVFTMRWLRLFGQVFRVFKWKNCSARRRGGGNVKIGFIDFQGLVGRAENGFFVFRAFHKNRHFHGLLGRALKPPELWRTVEVYLIGRLRLQAAMRTPFVVELDVPPDFRSGPRLTDS